MRSVKHRFFYLLLRIIEELRVFGFISLHVTGGLASTLIPACLSPRLTAPSIDTLIDGEVLCEQRYLEILCSFPATPLSVGDKTLGLEGALKMDLREAESCHLVMAPGG